MPDSVALEQLHFAAAVQHSCTPSCLGITPVEQESALQGLLAMSPAKMELSEDRPVLEARGRDAGVIAFLRRTYPVRGDPLT